jgi:hypothetical protein
VVEDQVTRFLLATWRQAHTEVGDPQDPADAAARDRFTNLLRRRGWRRLGGGFKAAMIKGGYVAKFAYDKGDDTHTEPEWRIWRRAPRFKRRFLARCYAYEDGLLIQSYHPQCQISTKAPYGGDCSIAKQWAERFRILDWNGNHGHRQSGLPVFFDYDNKGSGWAARRASLLFRRAA